MSYFKYVIRFVLLGLIATYSTLGQSSDLFFSEYHEGSSNNKYIEIYNGTGNDINLSDYKLELYSNGNSGNPNNSQILPNTTLQNGEVFVVSRSSASDDINSISNLQSPVINFNGDDALVLYKISENKRIDVIGTVGEDPGSEWKIFGTDGTQNGGLIRKYRIKSGNNNWLMYKDREWDGVAQDDYSDLGKHSFGNNSEGVYNQKSFTSDLIITEYGEGWTNENYIEIFNGTGNDIDLKDYSLKISIGGNFNNINTFKYDFEDGLIIYNQEVFVIANNNANDSELKTSNIIRVEGFDFDGEYAVGLFKQDILVDIFGIKDGSTQDIDRLETNNSVAVRK
ncbi:lamin tail domain-containing protein, partial [Candidatus Kapabacteria bacterium]|nr:lamin tail domain-containing protein [Candidatus Kapabacteria bacterium]